MVSPLQSAASSGSGIQLQPLHKDVSSPHDDDDEEDVLLDRGLLQPSKRIQLRAEEDTPVDWLRAYWLGLGLFLVLFSFWLLDSL
jgi:hypothetical protein